MNSAYLLHAIDKLTISLPIVLFLGISCLWGVFYFKKTRPTKDIKAIGKAKYDAIRSSIGGVAIGIMVITINLLKPFL